jgi:autoinducer 2-degrading protein
MQGNVLERSPAPSKAEGALVYHIASYFDVAPERHREFIDAALEDGRNSSASEPGTKRFELIRDENNFNRFYLNEAYEDEAAFERHKCGDYYKEFFSVIRAFAFGPTVVINGTQIEDMAAEAPISEGRSP